MSEIRVPEGMLEAFHKAESHLGAKWDEEVLDEMLEAALRWLSENPIVPSKPLFDSILATINTELLEREIDEQVLVNFALHLQRRLFVAPEHDGAIDAVQTRLIGAVVRGVNVKHLARAIVSAVRNSDCETQSQRRMFRAEDTAPEALKTLTEGMSADDKRLALAAYKIGRASHDR